MYIFFYLCLLATIALSSDIDRRVCIEEAIETIPGVERLFVRLLPYNNSNDTVLLMLKKEVIVSVYNGHVQLPQSCHSEIDTLVDILTDGDTYLYDLEYVTGGIGHAIMLYNRKDLIDRFLPIHMRMMKQQYRSAKNRGLPY